MSNGPFDSMFDFNGNGELDPIEEAMLIDFLDEMQKGDSLDKYGEAEEDDDEYDEEIKEDDEEVDERELLYPDLDFEELEDMDEDERRMVIEEAGYDPDDIDFDFD